MKKLMYLSSFFLFLLTSCEGPEGPMGPQGPAGPSGNDGKNGEGYNWISMPVTVNENEWTLRGNPGDLNSYFICYKPLSRMNADIYESGSVIVYLETEAGVKNGMPYVLHLGSEDGEREYLWTQTYDFDFDQDGIAFYVTYSDFNTQIPPSTEKYHVVMFW